MDRKAGRGCIGIEVVMQTGTGGLFSLGPVVAVPVIHHGTSQGA